MTRISDIGPALLAARTERGLTQRELGDLLGVHQQQVARWERDRYSRVALSRLQRIAEALGMDDVAVNLGADAVCQQQLLAAEESAEYGSDTATALLETPDAGAVTPVRDLGEVVARIRAHAAELQERYGVTRIDVFGSFARGEQRPDSDVDLIVEVSQPTLESVFGSEEYLGDILGRKADTGSFASLRPRVQPYVEKERLHVWGA